MMAGLLMLASQVVRADLPPTMQLAILLDGSGSMSGLINQARNRLWKIVNELEKVSKDGQVPVLQIAVYEYGKSDVPGEEGHIRQLMPLSIDLDGVSEKLFGIKTGGGNEYGGMVIQQASNDLQWSNITDDFRAVFIAGNETLQQGPVDLFEAIKVATGKDILVNAIHANSGSFNPEKELWPAAAAAGNGGFFEIKLNHTYKKVDTPFDDEILSLNDDLNKTFIPYGKNGKAEYEKMLKIDKESRRNGVLYERGHTKSGHYWNSRVSTWDLVSAATSHPDGVEAFLKGVKREDLPKELRELNLEDLVILVEDKAFARKLIRESIAALSRSRNVFIDRVRERETGESLAGLDKAIIKLLHKQLEAKGFKVKKD
jgi:hypothetical protein